MHCLIVFEKVSEAGEKESRESGGGAVRKEALKLIEE